MAENIEDKMPVEGSRCTLHDWLEKKAASDPQLRGQLLSNSQAALEKLTGRRMPAGVKIGILEETPQQLYLIRRYEGAMEPYEPGTSQGQFLSRSLHALALSEDDFWSKIKGDPKRILAERLALTLAEQVKVQVLEEDSGTAYFVLHHDDLYRGWQPSAEVMQKVRIKPPAQVATKPPVPPPPPAQATKKPPVPPPPPAAQAAKKPPVPPPPPAQVAKKPPVPPPAQAAKKPPIPPPPEAKR